MIVFIGKNEYFYLYRWTFEDNISDIDSTERKRQTNNNTHISNTHNDLIKLFK